MRKDSVKGKAAVTIVQPPGYPHSAAFQEVAETVFYGLQALGYEAAIGTNNFIQDGRTGPLNIVFGAHLLSAEQAARLPEKTVIYNLEQAGPSSMWGRIKPLLGRFPVWDYSLRNIEALGAMGYGDAVLHVPIGFRPEMARISPAARQDIDVLFYGSVNERRKKILEALSLEGLSVESLFDVYGAARDAYIARAKVVLNLHFYESSIFELVRVSYLLANRKAVVAECDEKTEISPWLRDALAAVPYGNIAAECRKLVEDDEKRAALEKSAFDIFSKKDEAGYLSAGLSWAGSFWARGDQSPQARMNARGGSMVSIVLAAPGNKQENRLKEIQRCLRLLDKYTPEPHETILAGFDYADGAAKWLKKHAADYPGYKFIETSGPCFAALCNEGIRAASGQYIVLLAGGVEVSEGWLSGMLGCMKNVEKSAPGGALAGSATAGPPIIGPPIVGPPIIGPISNRAEGPQKAILPSIPETTEGGNGKTGTASWQQYARAFREKNMHCRFPVPRLDDFCILLSRALFEKTGFFDEVFSSRPFAILDLMQRAVLDGSKCFVAADTLLYREGPDTTKSKTPEDDAADKMAFEEKWRAIDPLGPEAKKLRALKLFEGAVEADQRGDLEKAVKIFVETIKNSPLGDMPFVKGLYYRFARMLIDNGRFRHALELLSNMPRETSPAGGQSPAQSPPNPDSMELELRGYCKDGLGEVEEADRLARRALDLHRRASSLNLMGVIQFKKGMPEGAESFFAEAIKADSGYAEAYANLGAIRWAEGKRQEAFALFERAFTLSPATEDIITNYYGALMELSLEDDKGIFERGIRAVRDAIVFYPLKRRLRHILAEFHLKCNQLGEALNVLEETFLAFGVDDAALSVALQIRELIGPAGGTLASGPGKNKDRETLSICMIVKNEGKNIVRALLNLRPLADELIVVDTGSRDRTKEIARALGAKVFDFEWTGDFNFSGARNFSISRATGDWILVMDADEVISPSSRKQLRALIDGAKTKKTAYSFTTRNYILSPSIWGWRANDGAYPEQAGTGWLPSIKVRLFANDERIRFKNPVHEVVEDSLAEAGIKIAPCGVPIHHYGKLFADKVQEKGRDYFEMGRAKLSEKGGDDFKSAMELAVQAGELGRFEDALDNWKKAARIRPGHLEAHLGVADSLCALARYGEAKEVIEKAFKSPLDCLETSYLYARCQVFLGDAGAAIALLENGKSKNTHPMVLSTLALAHLCAGRKESGMELARRAGQFMDMPAALAVYARKLIESGRTDYARRVLEGLRGEKLNPDVQVMLTECSFLIAKSGDGKMPANEKGSVPEVLPGRKCWCGGGLVEAVNPSYSRCVECGTYVVKEFPEKERLREFYSFDGYWHEYVAKDFGYPPIEERAEMDFKNRIPFWHQILTRYNPRPEHLLEIGCAHGGFLHYCRERGAAHVVGVEVDERTCSFARERFNLPFIIGGLFPDVNLPYDKFDVICGFDVIEHFSSPVEGLSAVAAGLKDDGVCIFQTPCWSGEGREWMQFKPDEHLFLFTRDSIKRLFLASGLEAFELCRGFNPDEIIVLGRKKGSGLARKSSKPNLGHDAEAAGSPMPGMAAGSAGNTAGSPFVKSVLVGLTEHFGDIVACEPVSRSLKERYPEARITWAVREPYRELIDSNPNIDETLVVDCLTEWILIAESGIFDEVFDLHVNGRICPVCGVPLRKKRGRTEINVENYFSFGSLLEAFSLGAGVTVGDRQPRVYITDSAVRRVRQLPLPARYAVFHCESNEAAKDWPASKWAQLSSFMAKELRIPVVEVGARPVLPEGAGINLCNKLSLLETAEVIRRAALFAGVDSGPAHLANATMTPGVILLGRYRIFERYMPYTGCYAEGDKAEILFNEKGPASEIPLGRALEAVRKRLENKNKNESCLKV